MTVLADTPLEVLLPESRQHLLDRLATAAAPPPFLVMVDRPGVAPLLEDNPDKAWAALRELARQHPTARVRVVRQEAGS